MRSGMRWEPALGRTIIWTLLVTSIIDKITCSGVFELRLSSFYNEHGLNSEGNCCGGLKKDRKCTQTCRTYFRVCLTHYQAEISLDSSCTFGSIETQEFGNSFGITNAKDFVDPLRFPFGFGWPGTFTLIIEARNNGTDTKNPENGNSNKLILRLATQRSVLVRNEWSQFNHSSDPNESDSPTLQYAYRVICAEHFYGETCGIQCVPRKDKFGHYSCDSSGRRVCMPGWQGPYCDKAICLPGCNTLHGYCTQPNECRCRHGWQGENCDQCLPYPGCVHGSCNKPWHCNCDEGWGGLMCDLDLNYCTRHRPCKNGATCQNTGEGSYTCWCRPGFSGKTCEIVNDKNKDDCAPSPCLNQGTCVDIGRTFQCNCRNGYHGRLCESNSTSCSAEPCKYGGTCTERQGSYLCHCAVGYIGVDCEMEKDECKPNPCVRGECIDEFNGYRCVCPVGYSGVQCQDNENNCAANPCQNNGTCQDFINDFKCSCRGGFAGKRCEINVNNCANVTCNMQGTCKDLTNDYQCACNTGFYGKNCDVEVDHCISRPCKNGGVCEPTLSGYICKCVTGFGGDECQHGNTSLNYMRSGKSEVKSGLPLQQIVIIICLGAGLPIVVIMIVVIIFLCRRRRLTSSEDDDDDAAKRENEQNHARSMNNKCIDTEILDSIPPSKNLCNKLTNEIQNSKEFINEKPCNNKHLIRNDLQTIDEQVQRKELQQRHLLNRDFECSNRPVLNSKTVQFSSLSRDTNHKRLSSHRRTLYLDTNSSDESEYPAELRIAKKVVNTDSSANTSSSVYSLHTHHPYRDRDSAILATEV